MQCRKCGNKTKSINVLSFGTVWFERCKNCGCSDSHDYLIGYWKGYKDAKKEKTNIGILNIESRG